MPPNISDNGLDNGARIIHTKKAPPMSSLNYFLANYKKLISNYILKKLLKLMNLYKIFLSLYRHEYYFYPFYSVIIHMEIFHIYIFSFYYN